MENSSFSVREDILLTGVPELWTQLAHGAPTALALSAWEYALDRGRETESGQMHGHPLLGRDRHCQGEDSPMPMTSRALRCH